MISTKASAVSEPTPGCVLKRCASGHFSASCSIACVSSAIVGFSRSSNSSRSRRRRLAHGANGNDSSCSRPASRHNLFLQRSPSLSATACNWFMIRVRACTMRCRCHSSCRRSRFSQLGYPDLRKAIFQQQSQNQLRILAIRLLLAYSLGADLGGISDPQLEVQLRQQSFKPACMPTGFHPHAHLHSLGREIAIELLRFLAVLQSPLPAFASFGIHKRNLLEARVVITTYNHHVRLLSPEPWLVGTTKVYSGLGADIVMESLHSNVWSAAGLQEV